MSDDNKEQSNELNSGSANESYYEEGNNDQTSEPKYSFEDAGSSSRRYDDEELAGKLFIGGLSWQTTLEGLKFYFEKFGELKDAALMTDKRSGQPKGFGFVTFRDPAGIYI